MCELKKSGAHEPYKLLSLCLCRSLLAWTVPRGAHRTDKLEFAA